MHDEPQKTVEELKERQRNLTWPEALKNSRTWMSFFGRVHPKAPLVQRIGMRLLWIHVYAFCCFISL